LGKVRKNFERRNTRALRRSAQVATQAAWLCGAYEDNDRLPHSPVVFTWQAAEFGPSLWDARNSGSESEHRGI
jgi:hypothetical protein